MMNDESMAHIQQTSRRYRLLFEILIVAVPTFDLLYWISFNHLPKGLLTDLPVAPTQDLSFLALAVAFLASLLPIGLAVYGLVTLRALFKLYEKAIIFSAQNVRYFRRLGYLFIAWVVANALFTPLISIVITYANPPGERSVVAELGFSDISIIVIGGIILLISWVMDEGRKLEDEQAHTV